MSIEVSEAAAIEVNAAIARHFEAFPDPAWVATGTSLIKANATHAAAELVPGEAVEWAAPGIVEQRRKVWPGAILVVTPTRIIVSAHRGAIRSKTDVTRLPRGPGTVLGVSYRMLPGTSRALWILELAGESGPLLFALPETSSAQAIAEQTSDVIRGVAGTTTTIDPFEAAKADLTPAETLFIPEQRSSPDDQVAIAPPDWYDDPLGAAALRYWDGHAWTDHITD